MTWQWQRYADVGHLSTVFVPMTNDARVNWQGRVRPCLNASSKANFARHRTWQQTSLER
jgi:hypothetical protein